VDVVYTYPGGEMVFRDGDELDIAWANGSSRTYGIEIRFRVK